MTPLTISTADPHRRLRAFLVDRFVLGCLDSIGLAAAYAWFLRDGRWLPGIAVVVGTVLLVGAASTVLLGRWGVSIGKAACGLRVVSPDTGLPIGVARALGRWVLLGLATAPTGGLGAAGLAWTALVDPGGRRRGWHDLWCGSWVVELVSAPEPVEDVAPSPMVNLTTARLLGPTSSVGSGA